MRPFAALGLRTLLRPEPGQDSTLFAHPAAGDGSQSIASATQDPRQHEPAQQSSQDSPFQRFADQGPQPQPALQAQPASQPLAAQQAAPLLLATPPPQPPVARQPGPPKPLPNPLWPETWAGFWARSQHAPLIVWTYQELGQDLFGQPNEDRRALWKSVQKQLGWPRGTTMFWPMTASGVAEAPTLGPQFWEAVTALNPHYLAIFGPQAVGALAPQADPAVPVQPCGPLLLLTLPSPAELSTASPTRRKEMLSPLFSLHLDHLLHAQ